MSGVLTFWVAIGPKVMVCATGAGFTVKVWGTGAAAANIVLPACEAVMVQLPAVVLSVTVLPLTVQMDCVVDAKLTLRPEDAVAESATVVVAVCVLAVCVGTVANVIVCAWPFTLKLWGTLGAAPYLLLPACDATMVQVPMALNDAVVPETVQTPVVEELKLTVSPEDAVAFKLSVDPTV